MLLLMYIQKIYLYYHIFLHKTSVCWLLHIFQRLVPTTNTHITSEHSMYVLLKTTFGTYNSLKWFF